MTNDEIVTAEVRMTLEQLREIRRGAGIAPFDGRARGEYLLGCALGEPQEALLERVQRIAAEERVRFRAEIDADRRKRAKRDTRRGKIARSASS